MNNNCIKRTTLGVVFVLVAALGGCQQPRKDGAVQPQSVSADSRKPDGAASAAEAPERPTPVTRTAASDAPDDARPAPATSSASASNAAPSGETGEPAVTTSLPPAPDAKPSATEAPAATGAAPAEDATESNAPTPSAPAPKAENRAGTADDAAASGRDTNPAPAPVTPAAQTDPRSASSSTSSPDGYTLSANPTTQAGRGAPSPLDPMRPCVWISIDGREGRFSPGKIQWEISEPVSATPTVSFRALPPVVGDIVRVQVYLMRLVEVAGARGEKADESFLIAMDSRRQGVPRSDAAYPLCSAGDVFTYTDRSGTSGPSGGTEIEGVPPLSPGRYELVATIVGTKTQGERTIAITRFKVGE
ncbi:MAG: hypothetical protein KJ057_03510 [Phycisphaerae bacterium]|nr:MAG: hypothetical protein EDS66_16820 [Planctomycetota bacterium]KAB2944963.1 MAG: hypothetical protein F9K17_10705 [Phycisphaerae bacterium]MBE7457719.1 hypothetical protein [Planctomycetia bacterium]MCK6463762.1 hypothetical protein [Phycisphaerae bacterium]MCL4717521.1 hypothetical protein [Phycisphaerae bacterium]